ncbi:MAG: hypothetical protein K5945_06675, partial [Bacteroidaceae bacterium]|nr:hypothetical protein [Bacteroidaceae bacterium]
YSINGATDKPQEKPVVTFADITIAEAAAWVVGKTSGIVYDNNKRLVLQRAEVVYSNGGAVFVREGENAVEFYNLGVTCSSGDVLSGEIRCSLENYYGIAEFIKCDSTDVTTVTVTKTGNVPVPVEVTMDDVKSLKHLCNLVVVKNVTVAVDTLGTFIKDTAGNKLQLRTRTPGIEAPQDFAGKTYDVTGIPAYIYKGEGQLCAIAFTDIGEGGGVADITNDAKTSLIYDLQGRRVDRATANTRCGIYIINGKKVVR